MIQVVQGLVSGKFVFFLKDAQLTRDVKLIGKMNPYCVFKLGDIKKTSAVKQSGGKNPSWDEKIEFYRSNESQLIIEIYNMRKLGLFNDNLICSGKIDLHRFATQCQNEEKVQLYYEDQHAGQLSVTINFTPDVQLSFQQGKVVQTGEAPLDMNLRVVSALLTRDTQWFGEMSTYYVMKCHDAKFTSPVSKGGKTPKWSDKFQVSKKSDQKLTIEILNSNNNKNVAYCEVPHNILINKQSGVRTLPLIYEGASAGQIFLEVTYNSQPQGFNPIYQQLPVQGQSMFPQQCGQYPQSNQNNCQNMQYEHQNMYPPQQQNMYQSQQQNIYPPQNQNIYPSQSQNIHSSQSQYNYPPMPQQNNGNAQQQHQQQQNQYGIYPDLNQFNNQQQQQQNQQFNNYYPAPPPPPPPAQ